MKKVIKICILLVVIGIIATFTYNIVKINKKYPQVQFKTIPTNTAEMIGEDISMIIKSSRIKNQDEAVKDYGAFFENDMEDEQHEYKVFEIDAEFENRSEKTLDYDVTNIYIESPIYNNGLALEAYICVNDMEPLVELKANEKKTVKLIYIVFENQFSKKQWKNISTKDYYLVADQYPLKKKWMLDSN